MDCGSVGGSGYDNEDSADGTGCCCCCELGPGATADAKIVSRRPIPVDCGGGGELGRAPGKGACGYVDELPAPANSDCKAEIGAGVVDDVSCGFCTCCGKNLAKSLSTSDNPSAWAVGCTVWLLDCSGSPSKTSG